jgi:transcriptional regulator GlxA family with amidase domain
MLSTSLAIPVSIVALTLLASGCAPAPEQTAPRPDWERLPTPSDLPADRPLRAGFLIVDGVYNSELMAPYDIFHHTPFHTGPAPGIEVFTVSPDGRAVTTFEGLTLVPHHGFADAPEIDILVVPSAEGSMDHDLENERMMTWVRETGERARFVVSLCDGAFVLAAAGLLDDRAATTFPGDQDRFAETFPEIDLRRRVSFVHDGPALTSQGGARSYDVALYLVDHLYGEQVARGVARGLVLPWPPVPGSMPAEVLER